jgi:hypothetical protein
MNRVDLCVDPSNSIVQCVIKVGACSLDVSHRPSGPIIELVWEHLECAKVDIWSIQDILAVHTKGSIVCRNITAGTMPLRLR